MLKSRVSNTEKCHYKLSILVMGLNDFAGVAAGTPTIYEAIYPETVTWLKEQVGFSGDSVGMDESALSQLLAEMSRLNGIMNIEIGSDGEALQEMMLARLKERGVDIGADTYLKVTEPLSRILQIPDHLHALANMLGDGLVLKRKGWIFGKNARSQNFANA